MTGKKFPNNKNILLMKRIRVLIAYSSYWVFHTNVRGFNLRKTNVADEGLVG